LPRCRSEAHTHQRQSGKRQPNQDQREL